MWLTFKWVVDETPALGSFRALRVPAIVSMFKRPQRFGEYCAAAWESRGTDGGGYNASTCAVFFDAVAGAAVPPGAAFPRVVLPDAREEAARVASLYFVHDRDIAGPLGSFLDAAGAAAPLAALTNATRCAQSVRGQQGTADAAGARSGILFGGNFTAVPGGQRGWMCGQPCDWSAWDPATIRTLGLPIELDQACASGAPSLLLAGAHNRVPVLLTHFKPSMEFELHSALRNPALELQRIHLPMPTAECFARRTGIEERCAGNYGNGSCGFAPETPMLVRGTGGTAALRRDTAPPARARSWPRPLFASSTPKWHFSCAALRSVAATSTLACASSPLCLTRAPSDAHVRSRSHRRGVE